MPSLQQYNIMETYENLGNAFWLIIVAALWGCTNPFIKKAGQGIEKVKANSAFFQFIYELKFLILNWKYLLPFLLNQCGSIVFYITLAAADLSLAVPITNSLTFIFTGLAGKLLGEQFGNKETYIGIGLVVVGVIACVVAKS